MSWRVAEVAALHDETTTARTVTLRIPHWPGHLAGQHVDVRLTAPDGYTATRSYSIASTPAGELVDLTVVCDPDGEVSPYLATVVAPGDPLEVRGPVGGWFVWRPEQAEPVQLIGGGAGVVPLMAMLRARRAAGGPVPMRLLYSVRDPASVLYAGELAHLTDADDGPDPTPIAVTLHHTRVAPSGGGSLPARLDASTLRTATLPPGDQPTCYVCGPTGFVEHVAGLLVDAGHDPARIRTERFGPTGGSR